MIEAFYHGEVGLVSTDFLVVCCTTIVLERNIIMDSNGTTCAVS